MNIVLTPFILKFPKILCYFKHTSQNTGGSFNPIFPLKSNKILSKVNSQNKNRCRLNPNKASNRHQQLVT